MTWIERAFTVHGKKKKGHTRGERERERERIHLATGTEPKKRPRSAWGWRKALFHGLSARWKNKKGPPIKTRFAPREAAEESRNRDFRVSGLEICVSKFAGVSPRGPAFGLVPWLSLMTFIQCVLRVDFPRLCVGMYAVQYTSLRPLFSSPLLVHFSHPSCAHFRLFQLELHQDSQSLFSEEVEIENGLGQEIPYNRDRIYSGRLAGERRIEELIDGM